MMCSYAVYERGNELTFGRGPGLLYNIGLFNALSCYLSLIFKHSEEEKNRLRNIVDLYFFFLGGGGGCCAPPLGSATDLYV